jgi:hypothetical protein
MTEEIVPERTNFLTSISRPTMNRRKANPSSEIAVTSPWFWMSPRPWGPMIIPAAM